MRQWAGAGLAAVGFLAWAVRGRSAAVFGESVWRGDRRRKAIALTFDDGPSESTPRLLDVLEEHNVRATFFMCGQNVLRCPDIARAVAARGHELGNHTLSHPRLDFKTPGFIRAQIEDAQRAIRTATGVEPRWFRAPYGVRWFGVGAAQRALDLRGAMWTVIGSDWRLPAQAIVERVERRVENGAIICLHDGRALRPAPDISSTIAAVETLLPRLRNQGYEFATLSELCPRK